MYTFIKTTNVVKDKLAYTPIKTRYENDMVVVEIPHAADDYPTHKDGVDHLFLLGNFEDYGYVYMALISVQWEVFYIAYEFGDTVLRSLSMSNRPDNDPIANRASDVIMAYRTIKGTKVM